LRKTCSIIRAILPLKTPLNQSNRKKRHNLYIHLSIGKVCTEFHSKVNERKIETSLCPERNLG
jgi:hypothetical protein